MKSIGQKIKELRIAAGYTQEEFANGIVSRNQIGLIEKDLNSPSLKTLTAIADKLSIPMSYFLSEEFYSDSEFQTLQYRLERSVKLKDIEEASSLLMQLELNTNQKSTAQLAILYYYRGVLAYLNNEFSVSTELLKKASDLLTTTYELQYYKAFAYLALAHYRLNQYDDFHRYAELYMKYIDKTADYEVKEYVQIKARLSEYYIKTNQFESAYLHSTEYLNQAKSLGTFSLVGHFLLLACAASLRTDRHKEAYRYGQLAFTYYSAIESKNNAQHALGNIALTRLKEGQFHIAERIFEHIYKELIKHARQPIFIYQTRIHLITCKILQKKVLITELNELIDDYNKEAFQDPSLHLDFLTLKAYNLYLKGAFSEALEVLNALENSAEQSHTEILDFIYCLKSELAGRLGFYEMAYETLKKVSRNEFNIFK